MKTAIELTRIQNPIEFRKEVWNTMGEAMKEYGVPDSGKADSVAGELVRAINRIIYRWFNDGDRINEGYGKETTNAAARYLIQEGSPEVRSTISELFENPSDYDSDDSYEDMLSDACVSLLEDLENHPELKTAKTIDMWDLYDKEDSEYEEESEEGL